MDYRYSDCFMLQDLEMLERREKLRNALDKMQACNVESYEDLDGEHENYKYGLERAADENAQ